MPQAGARTYRVSGSGRCVVPLAPVESGGDEIARLKSRIVGSGNFADRAAIQRFTELEGRAQPYMVELDAAISPSVPGAGPPHRSGGPPTQRRLPRSSYSWLQLRRVTSRARSSG